MIAGAVGFGVILVGEWLTLNALAGPVGAEIGHALKAPLGPGEFFFALGATAGPRSLAIWLAGGAAAFALPAQRLRRLQALESAAIAREEQASLGERIARVEAMAKPKPTGGARVQCGGCGELVDASTTTRIPGEGILCPACLDSHEGAANENATYRD